MKRLMIFLFAFVLVISFSGSVLGATYYIDKNNLGGTCNNANPGTISQPWCTLSKAGTTAVAGDTVNIRSGTYYETLNPSNSGTSANPIIFKSYNSETVILEGSEEIVNWIQDSGNRYYANVTFTPSAPFTSAGFGCTDSDGGLVLQNGAKMNYCMIPLSSPNGKDDVNSPGEYYMDDSSGCSVSTPCTLYVNVRDFGSGYNPNNYEMRVGRIRKGIDLDGGEDYITIDGLEVRNVQDNGLHSIGATNLVVRNSKFYSSYITGIYLTSGSNNALIEDNEFWDAGHGGIELSNSDNHIIRKNLFKKVDLGDGFGANAAHISYNINPYTFDDTTIENNLFWETGNDYMIGFSVRVSGNNNKIQHNTFYRDGGGMTAIAMINGGNSEVKNNILYGSSFMGLIIYTSDAVIDGGHVIEYNDFYSQSTGQYWWNDVSYNTLTEWETASGQSNNIDSDPLFSNLGSRDFHLNSGSLAIDGGIDVGVTSDFDDNVRPQGLGYDIGAYEYISGTPTTCSSADDNENGIVEITELINYISQWKIGTVTIGELITAIGEWKSGC